MKRKIYAAAAAVVLLIASCGNKIFLPRMSEISRLEIVQIMGIDLVDGEAVVTLILNRGGSAGEDGWSGDTMGGIASLTAPTVFEAISKMNVYSDRRLHLGYVDYLIIGEETARGDITKCLDFLTRFNETRYTINIFLAKDATAKDFLTQISSESRSTVDMFANIEETIVEMNNTRMLTLIELLIALGTPQTATVIPALILEDADFVTLAGAKMPEKAFTPAGFGIIKERRLVGYYDTELTSAYNDLTGHVNELPVGVTGPNDSVVAMQVASEELVFEPKWDGDALKGIRYRVLIGATITEQNGHSDIINDDSLRKLEKQTAELAKTEFERVIQKAQEVGQDSLGAGDRLRMKNPLKWEKISESWGEIFSELDITVEGECRMHRSHDMRESVEDAESNGNE
ncbi:MAG: Ger(x)C family spore germination protein [Clostridiales bacterium]|nr:Ger(x)C family spore germination protein [Clostridiales bacterium]